MNIKIAIIDVGICKKTAEDSICNVSHFSLNDDTIEELYKPPIKEHGNDCFKEILKQNVEFDILDINITNHKNELKIENILLGIQKAIELRADIINVSLGFTKYTQALFEICKKAVDNNIAVISAFSHTDEVSYPSILKNVIGIQVNQNQKSEIEKVDDSTLSIKMDNNCEEITNYGFPSTSMASAYFSGKFAKILDGNPLLDKFIILKKLYGLSLSSEIDYIDELKYNEMELYKKIKNKKVAVALLPQLNGNDIAKKLKLPNIVAFYDNDKKAFYSFDSGEEVDDFNIILVINSSWHEMVLSANLWNKFKQYEILLVGKFNSLEKELSYLPLLYNHESFNKKNISVLEKPLILISGFSWDLNKFYIQKSLVQNFIDVGVDIKSVTYNPEGALYGFDVFEYPPKVTFPDVVCSINNYMCCTENNKKFDAWIVNVGGGMFINNFNNFSFGKLPEAYFHAAAVDILILCVPAFIDLEQLELNIKKAIVYGIKKILFVVAQKTFESSTLKSLDSIKTYCVDKEKYWDNIKYLKEHFNEEIFTYKDVSDGRLYEKIIEILT